MKHTKRPRVYSVIVFCGVKNGSYIIPFTSTDFEKACIHASRLKDSAALGAGDTIEISVWDNKYDWNDSQGWFSFNVTGEE